MSSPKFCAMEDIVWLESSGVLDHLLTVSALVPWLRAPGCHRLHVCRKHDHMMLCSIPRMSRRDQPEDGTNLDAPVWYPVVWSLLWYKEVSL